MRFGPFLSTAAAATLVASCLPVSNYHSAKTLGEGESSYGTTFSSTTYTAPQDDGSAESVTLPGLIPELSYHIGVTDNFEFGGRIAPGFLYGELDAKYRFLRSPEFHLAVAPSIGQMAIGGTVTSLRLPLIGTYEVNDHFAFTGSVSGSSWTVSSVPSYDDTGGMFNVGERFFTMVGGSLGIEVSGEVAYVRPSVEFNTMTFRPEGSNQRIKTGALVFHVGRVSGREKKQLDRIEEKVDRMEEDQEDERPPR